MQLEPFNLDAYVTAGGTSQQLVAQPAHSQVCVWGGGFCSLLGAFRHPTRPPKAQAAPLPCNKSHLRHPHLFPTQTPPQAG